MLAARYEQKHSFNNSGRWNRNAGLFAGTGWAQEQKSADEANKRKEIAPGSGGQKAIPAPGELEATFKATLTKATFAGRWCSIKNGALSAEKEDKYTIVGVSKVNGDNWIVRARIQYNNRDIVAPIPVQVKWAGDTPVLIVDQIPVLGGGVYSARVLIYGHTYAGSWSGGDHGGLLNGVITNESEDKPPEAK
jgi:hypothetical protein